MSEPTKSPSAKRLRLTSEPEQVSLDIAELDSQTSDPGGQNRPLPTHEPDDTDAIGLLLNLIQTDTGADSLANALKDRRIRDVLKKRGIKIQSIDVVGYNSLPLELRDQIRGYVIADPEWDKFDNHRGRCYPRLSAYACIDTEWQAAVETVTFKELALERNENEPFKDLDLFAQRVVGNRRRYLETIWLPCTVRSPHDKNTSEICEELIRRLFRCINQWHGVATRHRGLHLELVSLDSYGLSLPQNSSENQLSDIPVTSQIKGLWVSHGFEAIGAQGFLSLVSHLPQLKHITISNFPGLDFWSSEIQDGANEDPYGAQVLFDRLSRNAPKLESLWISVETGHPWRLPAQYREAIMSYSQKLSELHLMDMSYEAMLDCFFPFYAENFDPLASSPLSWPTLTTLKLDLVGDAHQSMDKAVGSMSDLMLTIARAVRHMPLIQRLSFELEYRHPASHGREHIIYMIFELSVFRDDALNGKRAVLSIKHHLFDPEFNFAEALASETAREVWRESLLRGANAVFEFDVERKDDVAEDHSNEEDPDEEGPDEEDSEGEDAMDEDE